MVVNSEKKHDDTYESPCRLYVITVRVTPGCMRLEISKPHHQQSGWITLLDAIADRWGDYGAVGGQQTLWAELDLPR